MSPNKEKKTRKKRRSDSDGVKVKRSYYSFSKYYPGGGSSQKYRKVMVETPDEHKRIKIILSVFAIIILVYIGCFSMSLAIEISNAPTTEATLPTQEVTTAPYQEVTTTLPPAPTYEVTLEEPEREVNVTTTKAPETSDTSSTDVTGE
ncbi:MAG: hypothetical protein E7558_06840 [Ruminococcaceae bacterium]|nr:hypothetical protein [Oscillospiraceae bacterium]